MATDPTPTDEATGAPEGAEETPEGGRDGTPEGGTPVSDDAEGLVAELRREAAGYRRRLRDVEGERDRLAAALESYRRAEAETVAAEHLQDPADLWLTGTTLADLCAEDGTIDRDAVTQAARDAVEARPHWRRTSPGGFDGGARPGPTGNEKPNLLQIARDRSR